MFQIKICGITSLSDAQTVAQAGADAVGLNFYPASPRCIAKSEAREICNVLSPEIVRVGVFVNAEAKEICRTFDELKLNLIQLHGDETPDLIAQLGTRPVMRAFRLDQHGLPPILAYLEDCKRLGAVPKLVLFDAPSKGVYGGSGEMADWSVCAQYPSREVFPPWYWPADSQTRMWPRPSLGSGLRQLIRPAGWNAALAKNIPRL